MRFDQQFIKSVLSDVVFGQSDLTDVDLSGDWEVNVDSRTVQSGEIFVAIKGSHVDGHDYIKEAVSKGVIGLIVAKDKKDILNALDPKHLKKLFIAIVSDTRQALVKLATAWRQQFSYPVVGITGSIGKTTTKEILCNILALNGTDHVATSGNQNTEVGVAMNILKMRSFHKVAIFEMGINKRGEMANLAKMVMPTTALITMVGHSHMEGLGALNDIAVEKRDIFKYFKEDNIGIVNGDQPILSGIAYDHPIIRFGCKTTNQIQARKVQTNNLSTFFVLRLYKEKYKIVLNTNHEGRVINTLAASAIANLLEVPHDIIVKGIQVSLDITGRFEKTQLKSFKGMLINDCYNASPESMKAALLAFEKVDSNGQKIAVLGDMLELGVNSPFWHRQLGRFLRKVPSLNHVVLVGDLVQSAKNTIPVGLSFEHVQNWKEAAESIKKLLGKESVILVKGSRGLELDNLVTELSE